MVARAGHYATREGIVVSSVQHHATTQRHIDHLTIHDHGVPGTKIRAACRMDGCKRVHQSSPVLLVSYSYNGSYEAVTKHTVATFYANSDEETISLSL